MMFCTFSVEERVTGPGQINTALTAPADCSKYPAHFISNQNNTGLSSTSEHLATTFCL